MAREGNSTVSGMRRTLQNSQEVAGRALNERTRLKIALTQILTEQGFDLVEIENAIKDVCNCDFRALRAICGLEPGKSYANPGYVSSYVEEK